MSVLKVTRVILAVVFTLTLTVLWSKIKLSGSLSRTAGPSTANTAAGKRLTNWRTLLWSPKDTNLIEIRNYSSSGPSIEQIVRSGHHEAEITKFSADSNVGNRLFTRAKRPDVVLRSAFTDLRARDGHANSTVILVELSKEFRKHNLIVGCGADEHKAVAYKINTLYWDWIDYRYPNLTHEEIMIFCYDVPAQNGSTAFILYHQDPTSTIVSKESVCITSPSPERGNQEDTVVICTTCFGRPPWLGEWLRYQKTLGVDLVQMYVDDNFMNDSHNMEIVKTYINESFLKIEYRKTHFNSTQVYYHSQTLNYNDCLYRHQSTHEYAMFIDTDDFFVPRLYNASLKYYLQKILRGKNASARFHWYKFFPDCGLVQPPDSIKDGNVTSKLKVQDYVITSNFKFACKPSLLTQVTVHKPLHLREGYQEVYEVNSSQTYMAHLRLHQLQGLPENVTCDKSNHYV